MGSWKKGRLGTTAIIFFTLIVFFGFGLSNDRALGFNLPVPAELNVTNIENPDIFCQTKITTDVIDADGRIIASEQSAFFAGNPVTTFSFTDVKTSDEVSGFQVTPKIKCNTPATGLFNLEQVPVTIKKGEMVVKVYSVSADGDNLIESYNNKITINQTELNDATEKELGSLRINSDDILKRLESGNYDSFQHIVLEGNFNIFWSGYPSVVYALEATTDKNYNSDGELVQVTSSLITFREITVDNDGGDGTGVTQCESGQFLKGNTCVTLTSGGGGSSVPLTPSNDPVSHFISCATQNPDKSCLLSSEFSPFYLIGIGLFAVVLASKPAPREMVYGMPQ